jgi:hypothetical protein
MYMKNLPNRPNTTADRCPLRLPLKVNPESKTEIGLRLCFAPLLVFIGFVALLLPMLLPIVPLVIKSAKIAPLFFFASVN